MSTESLCIDSCDIDDSLVLFSNRSQSLGQRGTFFRSFGENVPERNASLSLH
jgi:hypothetical protein